jgi:DNA-binding HxlR family transcriptional regulator
MYIAEGADVSCQVIRTLDIVGEKWSLLIVRDLLRGRTRFSEFRASLGMPTDVLTARLSTLVERGVVEKRAYREEGARERFSYHLTPAGEGLRIVVAALIQWGDEFDPAPRGVASRLVDAETREPVSLGYFGDGGRRVDRVAIAPGPAVTVPW